MPSFIATSDWHLGRRLGSAGPAAERFREITVETTERIVGLAGERQASALFLLGDTFDGDRVGLDLVERAAHILSAAPCPVFLLPGNHDWWHPGGVLQTLDRLTEGTPHLHVLHEPEQVLRLEGLDGVSFYACPVLKRSDIADPTRWIPPRLPEDGLRVGLIHGALQRADWGGRVPERVAEERDLDLALLGDWHKPVEGPDGRSWYCGSPEPGGFDEEHEGQVILVTVEAGALQVERVPVGRLAWRRLEVELEPTTSGGLGLQALHEALAAVQTSRAETALRVRVQGRLTMEELHELQRLLETLPEAGWACCDVDLGVTPEGTVDLDRFEEDSIRAVARAVWESEAELAVRLRALALLQTHVEATR